ncbi:DUF4267 domain-containing protein [Kitasatospora sp. NPDC101183]|uniref:DUF4267 domain-containing protein n=1 Tax=Kitasatospora sp. NPDC101183 TaxID=3364100 RepID=UPI0037F3FCB4
MSLKTVNTALTAALVLFVLWFGTRFIVSPETIAPTFGLPSWPSGDGDGFLRLKGIRDVAGGLLVAALLLTGQRRALGTVLLVEALIPIGDMTDVLAHHGSTAAAYGVHGLTAVVVAATGLMTLHEARRATAAVTTAVTPAAAAR